MKIPATIGMLTRNSEKNLQRALASVADFAEIIIADGGSTDATLFIAAACGARIISQSNPGHAITDFSRERNITLTAATQSWFFYLDSDEIMSPELAEQIRKISNDPAHPFGAYRVRYVKTNADASKIYRTYKEYYQVRLARTNIGAHFERPVHERIIVPPNISVGQTDAPWYVPLDADDLSFCIVIPKIWKRTGMEAREWRPHGMRDILLGAIGVPCLRIGKSLVKMVMVKIRWGRASIPMRYEVIRILYNMFLSIQCIRNVPRPVRYIISGGSAAVLNIGMLFVLTHFFGVWYLISSLVAFLVGFLTSFALQRTWTFDIRIVDGLARHTSLYFAVTTGNTFLNTTLVFYFVEYAHMWYVAAQVIAGVLIALMSFFIYRKIFV